MGSASSSWDSGQGLLGANHSIARPSCPQTLVLIVTGTKAVISRVRGALASIVSGVSDSVP